MSDNTSPNPFDPAGLRLDQSYADTVGVKKLLTTLPVRKPNRHDFVRVHPDPAPRSAGEQLWLKTLMQIRVLSRSETIKTVGLSDRTWDRLEAAGDTPPKTRISQGRIGYGVCDVKEWLDRRRKAGVAS
jgi:predicted DNA-binding transcriptional regulator AlpA